MRKLFDKNHRHTFDELDCQYCLYHQKKKKGEDARCKLEVCCCADEKREAHGMMPLLICEKEPERPLFEPSRIP